MSGVQSQKTPDLDEMARLLRVDSLRMIHRRGAGHPGGALSAAEIIAVLYFHAMRVDPARPLWEERDRFILSKGHASAVLYAALARRGFFPASDLDSWGETSCPHQSHPDRLKTPGVDMTSGILGHGIAVGVGLAMAARWKAMGYRTYVLIGDGESQAGIIWEGALSAAKFKLSNLTVILDSNGVQLDGFVRDVMPMEPMADKWAAFGWNVIQCDGHSTSSIIRALEEAAGCGDRPSIVIARTIKGKGVSFMENMSFWHGNVPSDEELRRALGELGEEAANG